MKKFHTMLLLSSLLLLVGLLVLEVTAEEGGVSAATEFQGILAQNMTMGPPANNTYFATSRPNFNFTVLAENETYIAEIFVTGTRNGSAKVNNTIIQNITINGTLLDGNYSWFMNFTNASQANRTNVTLIFNIDTTFPLIVFSTPSIANNSYLSNGTFTVNFTATDTNYANTTIYLNNRNTGATLNTTVITTSTGGVTYLGLVDGNYTVNLTTLDLAMNKNVSLLLQEILDTVSPSVTASVSPSAAVAGDTITLGCSSSDRVSSVTTVLGVKTPGASSFTTVTSTSYSSTTTTGIYTFRCTSTDLAGNVNYNEVTFAINDATTSSSSGGSSGSSGGSSSSSSSSSGEESTDTTSTSDQGSETSTEETSVSVESSETWASSGSVEYTDAVEGSMYSFSFVSLADNAEEQHTVTVSSVDETAGTVTVIIASDPQEVTLAIGESREVDVDSDGVTDVMVTLNGISNGVADISIAKLGTWASSSDLTSTETTGGSSSMIWVWVLVVLVVIAVVVLVLMRASNKGKKASHSSGMRRR